jgi:hypothetical protein
MIEKGRTVIIVRFSLLDSELMNVHVCLPTLELTKASIELVQNNPHWQTDIENAILNKCVLIEEELDWLTYEAPAGIASSLVEAMLLLAWPRTLDDINTLFGMCRAEYHNNFYQQIKQLVIWGGVPYQTLHNTDVYQLGAMSMIVEPKLVKAGILSEKGFSAAQPSDKAKSQKRQKPNEVDGSIGEGTIPTKLQDVGLPESERRALARELGLPENAFDPR